MVDFGKLRGQKKKPAPIDPLEIFRRLPKPPGINDLYTSQAEVLNGWFSKRNNQDVVVKLHTGGGKTLVGLLMAVSSMNESKEPSLYLAPTRQLVKQTLEKAKAMGIPAVAYTPGKPLDDAFLNGKAIMVGTYKALFNGRSKFGVRGTTPNPVQVSTVILDDAHVAFSVVRESFTLDVSADHSYDLYKELTTLFRYSFKEIDRLGTFDDTVEGASSSVLEVPYWAWHEKLDTIREVIKRHSDDKFALVWPLLRDNLHFCHAFISRKSFSITPFAPLVNLFPTFFESPRRIYMSATIADDSEIVRTFDADPSCLNDALSSRSLAGISERMILIPDLMPFEFNIREAIERIVKWTSETKGFGAVILVSSNHLAEKWDDIATFAEGSEEVEKQVKLLQQGETRGPVVFANRYDGIDLPGDSCRLLVVNGLPAGTSDYEMYRASTLYGGATINRMLAQRIEQGIGRGARGAGDHCVVLLSGADLAGWVAKEANFRLLTNATRAQLDMGSTISREVSDLKDFARTISNSFDRDEDWIEFHAETLAEEVEDQAQDSTDFNIVSGERKAFNLWLDGYCDKAISRIDKTITNGTDIDQQTKGWLLQLSARIADQWGQKERAEELQRDAFSNNRNLFRPKIMPPYRPLATPSAQSEAIASQLHGYRFRKGFLQKFEEVVSHLNQNATANQFEQALADLGQMLGFNTERHDSNGEGPDVLWLLPNNEALIIEAKSRKKGSNALTKAEHGQLLVAEEWFESNYSGFRSYRVSVHPTNKATPASSADSSYALTNENLTKLADDARVLLASLCDSQLGDGEIVSECSKLLNDSGVRSDRIVKNYLVNFIHE